MNSLILLPLALVLGVVLFAFGGAWGNAWYRDAMRTPGGRWATLALCAAACLAATWAVVRL